MAMSMKEMLVAVSEGKVDAEVMEKAKVELEKLDAKAKVKSEKAKAKKAVEDAPLMTKVVEYLEGKDGVLASEVAEAVGVSVSKAVALLKKVGAEAVDVKVPKVGVRKSYKLV